MFRAIRLVDAGPLLLGENALLSENTEQRTEIARFPLTCPSILRNRAVRTRDMGNHINAGLARFIIDT
jgi:hypothetical protein